MSITVSPSVTVRDLVVFDRAVRDQSQLASQLHKGYCGLTLAPNREALEQIGEILRQYAPVRSLHLVSHGQPGAVILGDRRITAADVDAVLVSQWRQWLTPDATISLYGCEVARQDVTLLERLAALTGATIAAARSRVGAAALGGRWVLDAIVGQVSREISPHLPWSESVLAMYPGVLAIYEVGTENALQSKLNTVTSGDIISLTGDIDLTANLDVPVDATIYGNGYAIDGSNITDDGAPLMIGRGSPDKANLVLYDITLRDGAAIEAQAYPGGLSTNSMNVAGYKVKFIDNAVLGGDSSNPRGGYAKAIGAAIYGGGNLDFAKSEFTNNDALLLGAVQAAIAQGDRTDYDYGTGTFQDIYIGEGSVIYAIGSSLVNLIDTTFRESSVHLIPAIPYSSPPTTVNLYSAPISVQLYSAGGIYATGGTDLGSVADGTVSRPVLSVETTPLDEVDLDTSGVSFRLNAALPYPIEFSYTIDGVTSTDIFPHSTTVYTASSSLSDDTTYNPGRSLSASVNSGSSYIYTLGTDSATIAVTDDEPLVSFASSTTNLTEGGSTTLTLDLDRPAPRNFAIAYSISGTASDGDDFMSLSGNASVNEGDSSATITIDSLDDPDLETDETLILTLTNTTNNYGVDGGANTATVTIADDEVAPTVTIASLQTPTETGATSAKFKLNLSDPALSTESQGGVSGTWLYYTVTDGSTTAGSDYTATTGQTFIAAGGTSATVEIAIVDDLVYEPGGETFSVQLDDHPDGLYVTGAADNLDLTIADNDLIPVATLTKLSDPIENGTIAGEFRVDLSSVALDGGVTIGYGVVSGSTTATSADYATLSGSVTVPEGQTQATVAITPVDDIALDPDETLTLQLQAPGGELYSVGGSDQVTLTIADNEVIPVATIAKVSNPTEADETPGEFEINLSSIALEGGVTVGYTLVGGSTTATSADYAALSGSVTFPENTTQKTIAIVPTDDGLHDPGETLTLQLDSPGGELYTIGGSTSASFTIVDNDHLYTVSLTSEANASEDGTLGYFLLELDQPALDSGLTVDYSLSGGDAVADADYVGVNGRVTVAPGATQARIRIEAIDNAIDAPDRTLALSLLPAAPGQIIEPYRNYTADSSAQTATIVITDDDTAGVRLTQLGDTTNETGTTAEVEIRLESEPSDPVTIAFTSTNPSEGDLDTASVTFNPSEWKTAKTVTVRGVDDGDITDGDVAYSLVPSVSSDDPAYSALSLAAINFSNRDNDGYDLLISTPNRITEGSTSSYTLALTQLPSEPIPVEILADDQAEVSLDGSNFAASQVANLSDLGSQTVFVRSLDDTDVEGRHTSTIGHRFLDHADSNYPTATTTLPAIVTIDDNDSPIAGVVTADPATEESVVAGRFGVMLDQIAPAGGVTIGYEVTTQTATATSDYVSFSGSLFIPEGDTGGDILVNPVQDSIAETGGETITVALLSGSGYSLDSGNLSQTVSIFDDDIAGVRVRETGNASRVRENVAGDQYSLELTSQPSDPVMIALTTSGDVVPSQSSLTFTANNWNQPQTVSLTMANNNVSDGDRSQTITHSVSSDDLNYSGLAIDAVTVELLDDDEPGMVLTETGFSTRVTEGSVTDQYTIVLESQPTDDVTVTVNQAGDSGLEPIAPLVFTAANWSAPQTVNVVVDDDFIDRDDRTTTLTHSVSSSDGNYSGWVLKNIEVVVTEDDEAGMTLTQSGGSTAVTENAFDDDYTIVLTSQPIAPVTVAVAIDSSSNLTPITPLVFEPDEWNIAQTVDVTLTNDDIDDDDRSATYSQTVTSSDPKYNGWTLDDVTVPITEDDFVGLTIQGTGSRNYVIEGSDNPDFLEIRFNSQPTADVTIAFDTGTELEPIDDLVVRPEDWETVFSIPFFAKQDTEFEATETIKLGFTVTSTDPKYDPTGGLSDTIPAPAALTIEVADRQLLGSETAAGLEVVIDRFADLFETNVREQSLPLLTTPIGELVNLSSDTEELIVPDLFLFKDRLLADLAVLGATDATTAKETMATAIAESFAEAGIDVDLSVEQGVDLDELTFDIGVSFNNPFETPLTPNLGLDELKFDLDGTLNGTFDAQLDFSLGWNERFGFFIDSEKTQFDTQFQVDPAADFTAIGAAGLLGGKATNDLNNATTIDLTYDLSLTDLDDIDRIRFLDTNANGTWDAIEPLVEESNGTFPELPILGRFDLDSSGAYEASEGTILTTAKPDDGARLTLTEILENATQPDLANGDFTGVHNLGLNLDTAIPGLRDAPIPRFLFSLASDWGDLVYDTETDTLAPLSDDPTANFNNFGVDVSSITGFITPIFDIVSPLLEPFELLVDLLDLNIVPGSIGKLFSTFDIGSIGGIDVDPFNFENFLEGIADIDINIGEFTAGLGDFLKLPSLAADLPTGFLNFGSFGISGPDLPELDVTLPELSFSRLPNLDLDLGAIGLPAIPGDFDISKFNRSKSIKFPILTDPIQGLYLVLGKEDVTLATLETPSLTGRGSLKTDTGIFQSFLDFIPGWVEKIMGSVGKFEANINAKFDVHAGLGFGFDTLGLYRWSETGFDPEQSDQILDGFFVSDRANPDGTGRDVNELDLDVSMGIGLDAGSLLSVSGKGRFGGDLVVDLKDPNGDGKVRFYSEILPQLPDIHRILSGHGSIDASGSAKLQFKIKYPSVPDVWNTKTWKKTLYNLKLPQTTLAKLSISDNGVSFGTAFDGPVEGSDVFFDANFNGVRDRLEPTTITFGEGDYDLDIPLDLFDRNGDGQIDLTEGQIIVENGTDTDTFQPQRFPFLTAPEWTIASPLTALSLRLAQPDLDATEANLETAFALPTGFDLQADDPFIAIETGDRNGVTVLAAQAQLQTLIILGANTLQTEGDRNGAATSIVAQVSQLVQTGTAINLSDTTQITAILSNAASAIGASVDSTNLSEIVSDIQNRNQAIVAASSEPLDTVRELITAQVPLEAIDTSYFSIAVEPWSVLLRTSQPAPPLESASDRVIDLLDLPNIDLGNFDPFANLDNRLGVEVLTRQIQLNATLTQIADIAIGAAGNSGQTADAIEAIETQVFEAIVNALETGVQFDDFSSPELVQSILQTVASPIAADRLADIIAASNANFSEIATTAIASGSFEDVRDSLVESQILVQYLQSQLLQSIAAGDITIEQFDQLLEINQSALNPVAVIENMIEGSDDDDTLIGTALNDWIAGRGGDDLLQGQAGDDQLYGNTGNDQLDGNDGDDALLGGADQDVLNGGAGDDALGGGAGADSLNGGDGDDNLSGGDGVDVLAGELGNDFLNGNAGDDAIDGGAGDDYLIGDAGDDAIVGGLGDDFAIGDAGRDSIEGGDGDDILVGFADPDLLQGGTGNDLLFGNQGNDQLHGDEGDDSIAAGKHDDLITGNLGHDYLFGNKGNDTVDGGAGDDVIYGGQDHDYLVGGEGNDTIAGDLGEDILIGQAGADVFRLHPDRGVDIIADFTAGDDQLELLGFAADLTFADLNLSAIGGNTQLMIHGETVAIFNGVIGLTPEDVLIPTTALTTSNN